MTPGFIGKIPSQGDFVHRRLPWEFIDCWDAWLQDGISAAREALDERWLESYLVAPVWRFLLGEGICAGHAWLGLWFPSVDRVGRHFPLTVAVPIAPRQAHPALLLRLDGWLTAVEEAALAALDPRLPLEQLDARLKDLTCALPTDLPAPGSRHQDEAVRVHLLDPSRGLDELAALLDQAPAGQATACWHTWGTERVPATCVISERLPDKRHFAAYLTGDWRGVGLAPDAFA
jgi:type VI secretion system protein ImpM